ncbi:MAG: penicillin acylase family protein [Candidatus Heimdallarchaeota archaeon]|nr:penicillin acylase family protein [Candidatus Heimdallarchaeota archaeon]
MDYLGMGKLVGKVLVFVLLTTSLGTYTGIKNSEDNIFEEYELDGIEGEVKVYRDEFGVPYIIADTLLDLLFVQGYEITRDRTFQMEYYRSLINGEFSRILGSSMLEVDQSLRDMGLKRAGLKSIDSIDDEYLAMITAYTNGVNKYIEDHVANQPMELQILGVDQKFWEPSDVVAMGSIVAFSWALGGMGEELLRLSTHREFGNDQALELFPVDYPQAREYLRNMDHELINNSEQSQPSALSQLEPIMGNLNEILNKRLMSNNWVVSGDKTASGVPIIANDPHQGLEAQGIWYRVNLFLSDESLSLQGMTFPGIPLITFGHNSHVAWGITAGLHDTTDLYYLNVNEDGSMYLINNTIWEKFEYLNSTIEIRGEDSVPHVTKLSRYGPMIDTPEGEMAMRWTLHERYNRDQPIRSLVEFNFAENVDEFHEALRYLLTGFNFVFADIEGNIASQVSGFLPIRSMGHGLIPQNGSNGENDWIGLVDYEDQYYEKNPLEGYLATANERVDDSEAFFIGESFAHRYRDNRISQVLDNGTDFIDNYDPNAITLEDMQQLQLDIKDMVVADLLDPVISYLVDAEFSGEYAVLKEELVDTLLEWDRRMNVDSIAATIFVTYRNMLTEVVFRDDIGDLTNMYHYSSVRTMADWFKNNQSIHWFDDSSTPEPEVAEDMVIAAYERSIEYLSDTYGDQTENWLWGDLHLVYLPHPLSSMTDIFNIGYDPIAGNLFTVMSSTEHGMQDDGTIDFTCTKAPYFRMLINVESDWNNVWGAVSSGASGHVLSEHYDDAYKSWLAGEYIHWLSDHNEIMQQYTLTAVWRKK